MNQKQKIEIEISFIRGLMEGIRLYAIWENGEQLVGCLKKPLKEVLQEHIDKIEKLKEQLKQFTGHNQ